MAIPREVKLAIVLLMTGLCIELADGWRSVMFNADADREISFILLWIGASVFLCAVSGLLIFQLWRRRNWARFGYLAWTLAFWASWLLFPTSFEDYSVSDLLFSVSSGVLEIVGLSLLFFGRGSTWYSAGLSHAP